jgi:hypothetical protein
LFSCRSDEPATALASIDKKQKQVETAENIVGFNNDFLFEEFNLVLIGVISGTESERMDSANPPQVASIEP